MGIKGLMKFLSETAAKSFKETSLDQYAGKVIACNATMSMTHYLLSTQFLASVGTGMLVDDLGDPTAHLVGLFSRTIQLIEIGIKPVWVFSKQASELAPNSRYIKNRQKEIKAFPKRSTKISNEMAEDAMKMIRLMGIPVIEAPENSEAQCAELVKTGKCYACISEDTDALAYGCNLVIRGVKSRNDPVVEIRLEDVLRQLDFTYAEFIDLCILLGTKKCRNIENMGPKSAFKYIQQCSTIENVLEKVVKGHKKYKIPKEHDYETERNGFICPAVTSTKDMELVWKFPEEDNLKQFLIAGKGFGGSRVDNGLKAIYKRYGKPTQLKIESFFINPIKRPAGPTKKKPLKKPKYPMHKPYKYKYNRK